MAKLVAKLSQKTGIAPESVVKLLKALASTAYEEAGEGFVLPGFGKFKVVQPPSQLGTNPFTGKAVEFKAPPEIEFTLDTAAKESFAAGAPAGPQETSGNSSREKLPQIKLSPDPSDLLNAGISDTYHDEQRLKLGGDPDWIQYPETPVCCGSEMQFYGQLDSIGGKFCIGDVGMLYVFLCPECCATRSIMHCY
ncbi:HU family DNA-binding protein [Posidoniimonas polymericola]|uniref:HU family DNA-binding protein n=1 Tax=Posidoniimonas polymericola TaxID=2528002 RepID=UPI0018D39387|nr:HU family DNA-binding protein [Posidoniimonas polymericola]